MNFSSKKEATFDEKGRVVLPADYKNEMGGSVPGGQLAVEKDPFEKCLNIYTMDEWEKRVIQVTSKLDRNNRQHNNVLDIFYDNFKIIPVPESCRMNIPNDFLKKVGIKKEVMFTGQGNRLRLWDAIEHSTYTQSCPNYASLFDRIVGGNEEK
jgi:MraZ protein